MNFLSKQKAIQRLFNRQLLRHSGKLTRKSVLVFSSFLFSLSLHRMRNRSLCLEEPGPSKKELTQKNSKIDWIQFSEEALEDSIKLRENIVIFVNPNQYVQQFIDQLEGFLLQADGFQKMIGAKGLKFIKLEFSTLEEKEKLEKKYNLKLDYNTILLLRNKYVPSFYNFSPEDFFGNKEYIFSYFRKTQKVDESNHSRFISSVSKCDPEDVFIAAYLPDKKAPEYRELLARYSALCIDRTYSDNKRVYFFLVRSPQIAQKLNMQDAKDGDLYLMLKSSRNISHKTNFLIDEKSFYIEKAATLKSNPQVLTSSLSKTFNNISLFSARSFEQNQAAYTFLVEADLNKMTERELEHLIKTVGELREEVRSKRPDELAFVKLNKGNLEGNRSVNIYIRDENKSLASLLELQLQELAQIKSLYPERNLPNPFEGHSYMYQFDRRTDLNKENLLKFVEDVREGKANEYFKTQKKPSYRKFSKKLVSKTFQREVLDNEKDQVVFVYSKHCQACKKYGGIYEQIGLEETMKGTKSQTLEFNRMNSDRNQLNCSKNFGYTPVFEVFKRGAKSTPFVYRNQKFTPELLKDFIKVTIEFELLKQDWRQIFQSYTPQEYKNLSEIKSKF